MELTSVSGKIYRVLIAGYHHDDDKMFYGSKEIFDELSPYSDGLTFIPISLRMSACPIEKSPSIVVLNTNSTHVEIQPFNTRVPHSVIIVESEAIKTINVIGSYFIPIFTNATIKLSSLSRVTVSFTNVIPLVGSIFVANTQFPAYYNTSSNCVFVPENILYEKGKSLEHIDENFQWKLYRVTPSTRLKMIDVVDDDFSFSFSTGEIELVMGYPVYLRFVKYFNVLEFQFTSDCYVQFESSDMFTLYDTSKYESNKTVKCSSILSFYKTKEYKNDLGNTVLYGYLLKLKIDSSCSSYVNYISFKLKGIIGATITVNKLAFSKKNSLDVTSCDPESVICKGECSSPSSDQCTPFCGKCCPGYSCLEGTCQ
ncbi:Transmembrane protein [Entamoeba marina]